MASTLPAGPEADQTRIQSSGAERRRLAGGRYVLERRIGAGGMAEVFLARDQRLSRPVAIKLLRPELASDPDLVARFKREAHAAAAISHPHIVAVYDWGSDEAGPFIAMEYVSGPTLREVLRRRGSLSEVEALTIARQVLDALGAAHARGLVHCDVNPRNILFDARGSAKVVDFGIVCHEDGEVDRALFGSAQYLPPERARHEKVDARSDIYSLGVTLYEMLAGRVPFDAPTIEEILRQQVEVPAPSVRRTRSTVSEATDLIVTRALSKDPTERFPDAEAMLAAIDAARRGLLAGMGHRPRAVEDVAAGGFDAARTAPAGWSAPALRHGSTIDWRSPRVVLLGALVAFGLVVGGLGLSRGTAGATLGTARAAAASPAGPTATAAAVDAAGCQFKLGFKQLRDKIPTVVGDCLENEHADPATGNTQQRTSKGLFVWRKADGVTGFTDGYRTWLDGPRGVEQRLNSERLPWEKAP